MVPPAKEFYNYNFCTLSKCLHRFGCGCILEYKKNAKPPEAYEFDGNCCGWFFLVYFLCGIVDFFHFYTVWSAFCIL